MILENCIKTSKQPKLSKIKNWVIQYSYQIQRKLQSLHLNRSIKTKKLNKIRANTVKKHKEQIIHTTQLYIHGHVCICKRASWVSLI